MDKTNRARGQYQQLGPEAKIESNHISTGKPVNVDLRTIGEALCPAGNEYKGSFTTHLYVSNLTKDVNFITQLVGEKEGMGIAESLAESVIIAAVSNMVLEIRKCFGFKYKTMDAKDKRTDIVNTEVI